MAVTLPDETVGRGLLRIARRSLHEHYGIETPPGADSDDVVDFGGPVGGIFATLELADELRGCVGYVLRDQDLAVLSRRAVVAAATNDPRFPRVSRDDVSRLRISITVLAVPVPLEDPSDIEIGRDGLIVERGAGRGLLLPQVAERRGFSPEQFLDETCRKAGLPPATWRESDAIVHRFEAVHFAESV